jgi:hypothetical protein
MESLNANVNLKAYSGIWNSVTQVVQQVAAYVWLYDPTIS